MAGRPYKCPYCRGTKTIWKGYRPLKEGRVRLRQCTKCWRKFTSKQHVSTKAPASTDAPTQIHAEEVIQHE